MRHSTHLVTLIERAEAQAPSCSCGNPMAAVERDGALWLECTEQMADAHDGIARGLLARLRAIVGHDRRLLLDADELAA